MSVNNVSQTQSRAWPQTSERARRPFGLKAIILLLIVQAVGGIVVVAASLIANPTLRAQMGTDPRLLAEMPVAIISQSILAPLNLLAATGLLLLRRWAWVLTMTLLAYSMALGAIAFFLGQPHYFSMVLNVIMVFYLNQSEVQNLFASSESADAT